ncbi:MAG TPA: ChaN family lipoprotein [Burkholderiaceae bacterium]|nr:ChaN family lipoprotein [Burkholderiaceae bacterium]
MKWHTLAALAATMTLLAAVACATAVGEPGRDARPLAGRIWDTKAQRFIDAEEALHAVHTARIVLLGETHDNAGHHALQLRVLQATVAAGRRPALVMEQLDREHQAALDAERARPGRTVDSVLDAARFDRRGWKAEGYRDLVAFALEHGLPIVAANISRAEARAIVRAPASAHLPPVDARVEQELARDIERGHCGERIEPALSAGMVAAQRARDVAMAQALTAGAQADGAVLIAGIGHVRADRGVPLYLSTRPLIVGFVDVDGAKEAPDPLDAVFATPASFDFAWFTEPAPRDDPCAGFRVR